MRRRSDCASPSDPERDGGDAGSSPWVQTWGGPQESTARAAAQTARSLALCLQETKGNGSQWPPARLPHVAGAGLPLSHTRNHQNLLVGK